MFHLLDLRFNKKTIINISIVLLSILLILIIHLFIDYECPFHKYLNIWCSGCGGIRMIKSIFKLEFYQAFRYNPLLFILFLLFIIYIIINILLLIKKKVLYIPSIKLIIIIIIVLVLYMIIRNIPYFEYLIPTKV